MLIDGNFPDGSEYTDGAIQAGGRHINVSIGDVNAGINSVLRIDYTLTSQPCGTTTQIDTYVTPDELVTVTDAITLTWPACP